MARKQYVVCISGYSGSGKDELAKQLIEGHGAIKVGLADPAKRHLADLYGFSEDQLFGPSASRNAGDLRYLKTEAAAKNIKPSQASYENPPEGLHGELVEGVKYWEIHTRGRYGDRFAWVPEKLGNSIQYIPEGHPQFWLSPREALQKYCELMNTMYEDTWVRKAFEVHRSLGEVLPASENMPGNNWAKFDYTQMEGIKFSTKRQLADGPVITCSSDFRHIHEVVMAKRVVTKEFMPVLVRVKRPSVPDPPYDHRSETEMAKISDDQFDVVIDNNGSVEDLHAQADRIVRVVTNPRWFPGRIRGWTEKSS